MLSSQTLAYLGAIRQQERISHIIANNLSNVQTVGFKKDIPLFHSLLAEASERLSPPSQGTVQTVFAQGHVYRTNNPLDVAIEGEGFFKVKVGEDIRYSRAGNFRLDRDGKLLDAGNRPVLGQNREITLRGNQIVIGGDGTIQVDGNPVGKLDVVTFSNLGQLVKEGHNLYYALNPGEEKEADRAAILQNHLESSNVNPVEEMISLMDSHRSFESCLKVIQSNDSLDGKAVNELGRV